MKYQLNQKKDRQETSAKLAEQELKKVNLLKGTAYLIVGLVILILSAEALVQASSDIAERLGVSTEIIGLTDVGTLIPIVWTETDLAIKEYLETEIDTRIDKV